MRIRDWSSDVCSSDLRRAAGLRARPGRAAEHAPARAPPGLRRAVVRPGAGGAGDRGNADLPQTQTGQDHTMSNEQPRPNRNRLTFLVFVGIFLGRMLVPGAPRFAGWQPLGRKNNGELLQPPNDLRSEEHTYELKSLMRISSDVFRLNN